MNFDVSPFEPLTFWAVSGPPAVKARSTVSLKEAVDQMLKAKTARGLRKQTVKSYANYLRMFIRGREEAPIASITLEDLEGWFQGRRESSQGQLSNAGRLGALFSHALRKGWIHASPVRALEKPLVDKKPPVILTPAKARTALEFAFEYGHWNRQRRGRWLGYLVLGMFVGLRPTECLRVSWDCFREEEGLFIVDAAASKVRRRRIIQLEPTALAWLKLAKSLWNLRDYNFIGCRRFNRALADRLFFEGWPQDLLRHTAASYLLARHRNAGLVAGLLGNSSSILLHAYQELVRPREAAEFWALTPEVVLGTAAGGRTIALAGEAGSVDTRSITGPVARACSVT